MKPESSLSISRLVKKLPAYYETRKFIIFFTASQEIACILWNAKVHYLFHSQSRNCLHIMKPESSLSFSQPVKKLLACYETRKFLICFTASQEIACILWNPKVHYLFYENPLIFPYREPVYSIPCPCIPLCMISIIVGLRCTLRA